MSSMFDLKQAAAWTGGRLVGDGAVQVQRVHTDTRTLQPGDLFVALKGDKFDANDFYLKTAAEMRDDAPIMGERRRGRPDRLDIAVGQGGREVALLRHDRADRRLEASHQIPTWIAKWRSS